MKEVKMVKDQYGSIAVQSLKPMEYINVKLHKGNKVFEKEINKKDGGTFTKYTAGVLHNGEDVYLQLTPALAKKWSGFNMGDTIMVLATPSNLAGGKAYIASVVTPSTESAGVVISIQERIEFEKIISYMITNHITLTDLDDERILTTLTHPPHNIELERAKVLIPIFKEFYNTPLF